MRLRTDKYYKNQVFKVYRDNHRVEVLLRAKALGYTLANGQVLDIEDIKRCVRNKFTRICFVNTFYDKHISFYICN